MSKNVICMIVLFGVLLTSVPAAIANAPQKVKAGFALLWTVDDQGWTTSHRFPWV